MSEVTAAANNLPPCKEAKPPAKAGKAWQKWKDLALRAATFQARVLLWLFYWICITPFAVVMRLFSDPLEIGGDEDRGGCWEKSPLSYAEDQY